MNNMKQFIIILLLSTSTCFAQQEALFSQYMFDRLIINPAYAGSSDMITGTLHTKNKFIGIDGAPGTQVFSIHTPIQNRSMGVGLSAMHDKIGFTNQTSVKAVYAYHIAFANGKLSLGLEGGLKNQSIDFAGLRRIDQVDNTLPLNKESMMVPDAAFGAYYSDNRFFSGIAVYNLLQSKLDYTGYDRSPFAKLSNHYLITGGYNIKANENIKLEPSLLIKYVKNAPVQIDININATYKEMFTFGSSFRTGDAIALIVKYCLKDQLSLVYAYDFTISELTSYTNGSHEFMLGYNIKPKERVKKPEEPIYEVPEMVVYEPIADSSFLDTIPEETAIIEEDVSAPEADSVIAEITEQDTITPEEETKYPPGLIIFEGIVREVGASNLGAPTDTIELQGVSVKLLKGHDVIKEVITSEHGEFSFDILLTAGNYSLYVVKEGYIDRFYEITTTIDDDNRIIKQNFELVRKKRF